MITTSKDKRPNEFELRPCSGWSDEDGEIQYGITLAERMAWYGMAMPSNTQIFILNTFLDLSIGIHNIRSARIIP
ncbi:11144_t:CDS:2 [Entrophospora sp. SA101]|nr:11144_t:CDS:2 [Entrophospora sp. SA101]